jgi:hypothetical protein
MVLVRDRMPRSRTTFVLLAVLAGPGAARAAESVPPAGVAPVSVAPAPRATAIGLSAGPNSTVGLLGLTVTRAFGAYFQLEVAGGVSYWGTQLSLMPKVVVGTGRDRYVGGIGVARKVPPSRDDCCQVAGSPTWLIVDAIGYEHRYDSGFAFGFALGPILGLGGGRLCRYLDGCGESDLHDVAGVWGGQARLEIAYWF